MENRKKLSVLALTLMIFTAVFSFPSIINNTIQVGLSAIPSYIFSTIFYFLPFALMIAELSSANEASDSGIHSWIECSLGPKWAFLGAWAYFFVNLFYFTSLLPQTLIYASYTFTGRNIFEGNNMTLIISIISIIVFWLATYISIKGVSWISAVTNISGIAKILLGLGFIILAFIVVFGKGEPSAQEITIKTITPKFNWTYFLTMAWILQAVGGAESIGVYVKDIKGGNKAFVKTIVISSLIIGLIYALGCTSIGLIVPEDVLQHNFSNGIFDSFSILASHFGINKYVNNFVGLIMLLCNIGSLVIWTAAPVKVLFSEIPEGIFGKWASKTDETGNPQNALVLQAIVVTILLIIPAFGIGSMDNFLQTLINMTASTSLIPVLFFIVAYIVLRMKKDNMKREFKFGNRTIGLIAGFFLLALFSFTVLVSTIPSPSDFIEYFNGTLAATKTNPVFVLLYSIIGLIVFIGFAYICWIRYEKKSGLKSNKK